MATPPEGMSREEFVRSVDWVIQQRRTRKLHDGAGLETGLEAEGAARATSSPTQASPAAGAGTAMAGFEASLRDAISVAGWAPFHYPSSTAIPEPWRFYVLDRATLDALAERLAPLLIGKLPLLFERTGALVQVTWIPESDAQRSHLDWEHAAAAAAAVQNLLLACEARGMATYWSSSKPLSSAAMFEICGIPAAQRHLASVFVGRPLPPDREATEGFDGKMRRQRTPADAWCTWIRES